MQTMIITVPGTRYEQFWGVDRYSTSTTGGTVVVISGVLLVR